MVCDTTRVIVREIIDEIIDDVAFNCVDEIIDKIALYYRPLGNLPPPHIREECYEVEHFLSNNFKLNNWINHRIWLWLITDSNRVDDCNAVFRSFKEYNEIFEDEE